MNKLIVSSVALVASLAGSAMAADMPIRPPVVVESWTGFYVGVALGGRFSEFEVGHKLSERRRAGRRRLPVEFCGERGLAS